MPIYEYRCPTCQTKFEMRRSMSQSDETTSCPNGHPGARRLVSAFASFSKSASGETAPIAGGGSSCSSCSSGSCSTCG